MRASWKRLWMMTVSLSSLLPFAVVGGAAESGSGTETAELRIREQVTRNGNGDRTGRFTLRARLPAGPGDVESGDLRIAGGGMTLLLPLDQGADRWQVDDEARRVRVRLRQGRHGTSIRARARILRSGGQLFGGHYYLSGTGPVWGLETVSIGIGESEHVFATGIAGRMWPRAGSGVYGGPEYLALRGWGMRAEDGGTGNRTALHLVQPGEAPRWRGRVAGMVLTMDPGLRLDRSLDGLPSRSIEPIEWMELPLGDITVRQANFDVAVSAAPGWHYVEFGASDEQGRRHRGMRFEVPDVRRAILLDVNSHVLEAREDGRIRAWGENLFGEVGDGTFRMPHSPVELRGPENVVSLAGGDDFSMAVDGEGSLWHWGDRSRTLEDEFNTVIHNVGRPFPTMIPMDGRVRSVAAGYEHGLVLMEGGTVRAWGWNDCGQLGDGTFEDRDWLVRAKGLHGVRAIAAGDDISMALREDGSVWSWGADGLSRIGDLEGEESLPTRVAGLPPIVSIAAGYHCMALDSDGTVWTWGSNEYGELGDGTTTDRGVPGAVAGLPAIRLIAAGEGVSLAVDFEGRLWSWGANECGQLGRPAGEFQPRPALVPGLENVVMMDSGYDRVVVVLADGSMWTFGWYEFEGPVGAVGGLLPVLALRDHIPGHAPLATTSYGAGSLLPADSLSLPATGPSVRRERPTRPVRPRRRGVAGGR